MSERREICVTLLEREMVMRERLSEASSEAINNMLPDLPDDWQDVTFLELSPFLFSDLDSEETSHISLVCLADAFGRSRSALFCVFESYASVKWYRDEKEDIEQASREVFAVHFGKFFAEYNFLFLYAIGEDIAEFILKFLTKTAEFETWKKNPANKMILNSKRVSSNAANVGIFMGSKFPRHEITEIILKLRDNDAWKTAMKYRNTWVHDKPPIVDGLGIQYNRKSRIFNDGGAKGFGLGVWSKHDYSVDEVIKISHDATVACVEALSDLLGIVSRKKIELGNRTL